MYFLVIKSEKSNAYVLINTFKLHNNLFATWREFSVRNIVIFQMKN